MPRDGFRSASERWEGLQQFNEAVSGERSITTPSSRNRWLALLTASPRKGRTKAMAVIRTDRGHGLAFGIRCVSRVKKDTVGVRCSCNNGMGCRANIATPKGKKGASK